MHPRIIAQRSGDAQKLMMEASKTVAQRWGIPAPVAGAGRYNEINEMMTWEAIAGFVESLATVSMVKIDEVLAVPNLSKTSIKAIEAHFNVADPQQSISEDQQNTDEDQQNDGADPMEADQQSVEVDADPAEAKPARKKAAK